MIGQTISHYKITAKLGEGGMGVVYKAEDTSLGRPVALKFLAAHLIRDEEARKRFEREAHAAAALQHPHVCTIHEIGQAGDQTFLAMAFIDGESLEAMIAKGPLPLPKALDIGQQIAKGLQAAHDKGIVHRDIKPANAMVDAHGHVTVMDFGLALLTEGSKLTQLDSRLGTVAYMSPEQAQGMQVDHRTDIWALGCVLYEMVSGQRPFKGQYDQALLYEIVQEEPEPLTAVRTGVPMELEWIVGKCLAKNSEGRYQTTAEIVVDLRTLAEKLKSGKSTVLRGTTGQAPSATIAGLTGPVNSLRGDPLLKYHVIEPLESTDESVVYRAEDTEAKRSVAINIRPESAVRRIERRQRLRDRAALAAIGLLGLALLVVGILWLRQRPGVAELPLRRFSFTPQVDIFSQPQISPDGRHIAYRTGRTGQRQLWVRDLGQEVPRQIASGADFFSLSWSPDSNYLAYFDGSQLKRISIQGGAAAELYRNPQGGFGGVAWSSDGDSIVFAAGSHLKLHEVPASGGMAQVVFEAGEDESPDFPCFLPAGGRRAIVFSLYSSSGAKLAVLNLETGERTDLIPGSRPVYSTSGHIVYSVGRGSQASLWALPFSATALKTTGDPFPVRSNVSWYSVSPDGTLVFTGEEAVSKTLVWRDRAGQILGTIGQPQQGIASPAVSPDGSRVAVRALENENHDIWIHDTSRNSKTRLTFDPAPEDRPTWLPDGGHIAFSSRRKGTMDIFLQAADGSGETSTLLAGPEADFPFCWSADGRYLVFDKIGAEWSDIWYLKWEGGKVVEQKPFAATNFDEAIPALSPDGRYLAYQSDESGRPEIYVRPFPEGGGKWQVSANGGVEPRWRNDGAELYFVRDRTLMAVPVSTSPSFSMGAVTELFVGPESLSVRGLNYDVSADGQRFVVVEPVGEVPRPAIHVAQNWFAEFRGREKD